MKKTIYFLTYLVVLVILAWSVVLSGYSYRFDADEIFNANTIYLMLKGYKPYVDFYTVYSPILHWILTPVFLLFGFNFKAVSVARIIMIVFFFIRLLIMYLLVKRVFGKRAGLIFIPLYLMSPFVVFSEMQIRPDNLMMLFYAAFLLIFSYAIGGRLYFLSGILLAVTLLTNIKIAPSLVAFGIVFLYFVLQKRNYSDLWKFINGFCLTFLVFFVYFFIKGYVGEMFLHVFLDPVRLNGSIPHPTWLGYFYFSNPTIYGLDGKPLNWIYTWSLPVLAFAGGYAALIRNNDSGVVPPLAGLARMTEKEMMKTILFFSLVLQWVSMLFINSVFIQYYIPLNWLYAVFAAYLIDDLVFKTEYPKFLKIGMVGLFLILFISLFKTSVKANISRAKMSITAEKEALVDIWKKIPPDSPAYPNVVFRPIIYPVLWGSTFAPYMRNRYPPVYLAIEKNKLPILTGLTDEYFSYLDIKSQQYIQKNYRRDILNNSIWKRMY